MIIIVCLLWKDYNKIYIWITFIYCIYPASVNGFLPPKSPQGVRFTSEVYKQLLLHLLYQYHSLNYILGVYILNHDVILMDISII